VSIRPTLEQVYAAADRLKGVAVRTPLVPLHSFANDRSIFLKLENLQPIGSFKLRGIFNAVAARTPEERARGLSTTSSGNTAQALAWAGRYFGVPARSLMPDTAPIAKIRAMEAYGGTPVLVPGSEVFRFMLERGWEDEPYTFVHPWTEMAGAGTIGLEVLEDLPEVDTVFVPMGGGGLSGGLGSALKALRPATRLVLVEPEGCPTFYESRRAGHPVRVNGNTICDGVLVPIVIPEVYEVLSDLADDVVLVSDDTVKSVMKRLALRNKVVVEPSGALAVAAALAYPPAVRGTCACIVTGGSVDPALFAAILTDESVPVEERQA
jgi:threonine dehydratase